MTQYTDNATAIQNAINDRREELFEFLCDCIDTKTNDFFYKNYNGDLPSLTELCEQAKDIQFFINRTAVLPTEPELLTDNTLDANALNIYNKVQYCNNLLRYFLRKSAIDFGYVNANESGCNKTEELIQYLKRVHSVKKYDYYVTDVNLTQSKDLLIDKITFNDLSYATLVTDLYLTQDGDLIVIANDIANINYEDIVLNVFLDNGDLIYEKVSDME